MSSFITDFIDNYRANGCGKGNTSTCNKSTTACLSFYFPSCARIFFAASYGILSAHSRIPENVLEEHSMRFYSL
jgi:hypothetical protein